MEQTSLLPVRILHDFADRMEMLGVAYMLTGSMAMMNYSVYRFTADVDVILEIQSAGVSKIIEALEPDYYVPHESARRAVRNEKMFNVIHQETAFKIDCVVKKSTAFERKAFERRGRVDFYGRDIRIITKEDLIIAKLWRAKDSGPEKQLTDVRNLLKAGFGAEYVENRTRELKIENLLEQCRKGD